MNTAKLAHVLAEVQDEHRRAMEGSRRMLLRGGIAAVGATATAVVLGAGRAGAEATTSASAEEGGDTSAAGGGGTTAAGTTTTSPRRPQPEDVEQLTFAQSLELAAVAAYQAVIDSDLLDEETAKVARLFQRHHQEHANAHGGLAGKETLSEPNPGLVELYVGRIARASTVEQALQVAYEIENAAAATHVAAIGEYQGTEPASLAASVAPVEGRHAVVIGQALGLDLAEYVPEFQTTADAVTAEQYPVQA